MNNYRVYTYSKDDGYNEFLYSADSIQSVVNHHCAVHPELEIIRVEKYCYLER